MLTSANSKPFQKLSNVVTSMEFDFSKHISQSHGKTKVFLILVFEALLHTVLYEVVYWHTFM